MRTVASELRSRIQLPSEDDYRLATAYHESGHAIALHALGGSITDFCMLHVEPSQGWRGQVAPRHADKLLPETAIAVWFAGPLAECLYWAAFDESKRRSVRVEEALGAVSFDESDELASFIDDVLRKDENGDIPKTCVGLLIAGKRLSHMQRTSAFVGDVQRSVEFADKNSLDPQPFLFAARRVLNDPVNHQALVQVASYVAGVPTTAISAEEALGHNHRKALVEHLRSQPQLELRQADISLEFVNSFLPPRSRG